MNSSTDIKKKFPLPSAWEEDLEQALAMVPSFTVFSRKVSFSSSTVSGMAMASLLPRSVKRPASASALIQSSPDFRTQIDKAAESRPEEAVASDEAPDESKLT